MNLGYCSTLNLGSRALERDDIGESFNSILIYKIETTLSIPHGQTYE